MDARRAGRLDNTAFDSLVEPEDTMLYLADARRYGRVAELPVTDRWQDLAGAAVEADSFETHVRLGLLHQKQIHDEVHMLTVAKNLGATVRRKAEVKGMVAHVEKHQKHAWVYNHHNPVKEEPPPLEEGEEEVVEAEAGSSSGSKRATQDAPSILGTSRKVNTLKERMSARKGKQHHFFGSGSMAVGATDIWTQGLRGSSSSAEEKQRQMARRQMALEPPQYLQQHKKSAGARRSTADGFADLPAPASPPSAVPDAAAGLLQGSDPAALILTPPLQPRPPSSAPLADSRPSSTHHYHNIVQQQQQQQQTPDLDPQSPGTSGTVTYDDMHLQAAAEPWHSAPQCLQQLPSLLREGSSANDDGIATLEDSGSELILSLHGCDDPQGPSHYKPGSAASASAAGSSSSSQSTPLRSSITPNSSRSCQSSISSSAAMQHPGRYSVVISGSGSFQEELVQQQQQQQQPQQQQQQQQALQRFQWSLQQQPSVFADIQSGINVASQQLLQHTVEASDAGTQRLRSPRRSPFSLMPSNSPAPSTQRNPPSPPPGLPATPSSPPLRPRNSASPTPSMGISNSHASSARPSSPMAQDMLRSSLAPSSNTTVAPPAAFISPRSSLAGSIPQPTSARMVSSPAPLRPSSRARRSSWLGLESKPSITQTIFATALDGRPSSKADGAQVSASWVLERRASTTGAAGQSEACALPRRPSASSSGVDPDAAVKAKTNQSPAYPAPGVCFGSPIKGRNPLQGVMPVGLGVYTSPGVPAVTGRQVGSARSTPPHSPFVSRQAGGGGVSIPVSRMSPGKWHHGVLAEETRQAVAMRTLTME